MLIILLFSLTSSFFHVIFIVFENNIRQSHVTKVSYLRIRMPNSLENFKKTSKTKFCLVKSPGKPAACLFFLKRGGVIFTPLPPSTKIGLTVDTI